jgi:hypothetical protein
LASELLSSMASVYHQLHWQSLSILFSYIRGHHGFPATDVPGILRASATLCRLVMRSIICRKRLPITTALLTPNSMACSFILPGEPFPVCATRMGCLWSELPSDNGQFWPCHVRANRNGRYASRTGNPPTLRGGRLSLEDHTNYHGSQKSRSDFLGIAPAPDVSCASVSPSAGGRLNGLISNRRRLKINAQSCPTF